MLESELARPRRDEIGDSCPAFDASSSRRSASIELAAGDEVTVSVASIADQLKTEVAQLPSVLQARPKVSVRRKGVVVDLDVKIVTKGELLEHAEAVVETVQRVVEQKMGLRLACPPTVNIEALTR
jgi:hypothetical protein